VLASRRSGVGLKKIAIETIPNQIENILHLIIPVGRRAAGGVGLLVVVDPSGFVDILLGDAIDDLGVVAEEAVGGAAHEDLVGLGAGGGAVGARWLAVVAAALPLVS